MITTDRHAGAALAGWMGALALSLVAAPEVTAVTVWTEDWDSNGTADHAFKDDDEDDNPDFCVVYKDTDAAPDLIMVDSNDDGVWETMWRRSNVFAVWITVGRFSVDLNGSYDQQWSDGNGDGQIQPGERTRIDPPEPVPVEPRPRTDPIDRIDCTGQPRCLDVLPAIPLEPDLSQDDQNFDLIPDHWFADTDGDGTFEWAAEDLEQDGRVETEYVDHDDDGSWDVRWRDMDLDGDLDAYDEDTDGDGFYDQEWSDVNLDGRIQSVEIATIAPIAVDPGPTPTVLVPCDACGAPRPFLLHPPSTVELDRNALSITITDQGILGSLQEWAAEAEGEGLLYPSETSNQNHLYTGSLWVAQCENYVANRDYDAEPDPEWVSIPFEDIEVTYDTERKDASSTFNDDGSTNPFGFYLRQESWAFDSSSDADDFVIVRFFIHNRSESDLTDLRVGLFLDLDIEGTAEDDAGATDTDRSMAYLTDPSGLHVGVRLLQEEQTPPRSSLTLIPNPTYVWPQSYILDADKFSLILGDPSASLPVSPGPDDYSLLVAVGPFDLAVAESTHVTFGIIGATNLPDLEASADRAQSLVDPPVAVPGGTSATVGPVRLLESAPNPFRAGTHVRFDLARRTDVKLSIYDVAGRLVRTLVTGPRDAGRHVSAWDGRDASGRLLGSGRYYVQLSHDAGEVSRPITSLR